MPTLNVDFNEYDEKGLLTALLAGPGRRSLAADAYVLLKDTEGNRAWGRVERVEGRVAFVSVDWPTWQAAPSGD